jgi:thiol:disulfide interchange protein DsbD
MDPAVAEQSALTQLISVFIAGIGTSLTPCVYPLIPITLAVFGATPDVGRGRAFRLSLTYVLGIAATYTALGIFSAKTGALFGGFLGNPLVAAPLALFLIVLALYSLDIFQIRSVSTIQSIASSIGGKGFRGAFLMGTVSGLVAAPCAGPWLVVVLGIAAASENSTWGAILLFTYALGMGLLFIALGTFPALLRKIPRSGDWLIGLKFIMAAALLTVALVLVGPFLPPKLRGDYLAAAPFVALASTVLAVVLAWGAFRVNAAPLKVFAALLLAWTVNGAVLRPPESSLQWESSIEAALETARSKRTLAFVDLFAEWCGACKELEKITFSDPAVQRELAKFATARIDFTVDSPANGALAERYGVVGLPCLLFLDANGVEIPETRITGFLPPAEFLAHLNRISLGTETEKLR